VGSSYLPSDLLAAVLWSQLQHMSEITAARRRIYARYAAALRPLAARGLLTLPSVPRHCGTNYHIFYVLARDLEERTGLIEHLKRAGILAPFHYVPLHTSPMGASLGYGPGSLPVTEAISDRLLRLPLFPALSDEDVGEVIEQIFAFYSVARVPSEI
jgi:dTDP-4-amino-4,6-dideoxygalactose transaminase